MFRFVYILFIFGMSIFGTNGQFLKYFEVYEPNLNTNTNRWIRVDTSQPKKRQTRIQIDDVTNINEDLSGDDIEQGRHIRPQTLHRITETLGAINTVGRYLVNMTRNSDPNPAEDLPNALYTISKNFLGSNVTDTIAPFVREVVPVLAPIKPTPTIQTTTTVQSVSLSKVDNLSAGTRTCTTPEGDKGICDDLSNCPQLLLNLGNLRQSLCFKSLFVPGVCCPIDNEDNGVITTTTTKPIHHKPVTVKPLPLRPATTTVRPLVTPRPTIIIHTTPSISPIIKQKPHLPIINNTLIVDPNDCGQPESAKFRVVGGEEALPGRWPWMAAIFLHGPRRTEFWCGGSLITAKHVLTAAHCTKDTRQRSFSPRQFTVRLGDIDLERDDEPSNPITVRVADIRAHPRFSRVGFYNDIAIFVLETAVRKSRYVIPLCLPPPSLRVEKFAGQRPMVVGWGTTYYGGKESTIQRQAVLPVWRNEDCNQAYFQPITENFICAGYANGGVDACQGDSGGPLMLLKDSRWIQIGIVSFGNKCGEPGYPGVYTRVTEYLDWIEQNIGHKTKEFE